MCRGEKPAETGEEKAFRTPGIAGGGRARVGRESATPGTLRQGASTTGPTLIGCSIPGAYLAGGRSFRPSPLGGALSLDLARGRSG
jgi:hypothetical protein